MLFRTQELSYFCCMQNETAHTVPLDVYQEAVKSKEQLEVEVQQLKDELAMFKRMLLGRKSERFVPSEEATEQLKLLFDQTPSNELDQKVAQIVASYERKAKDAPKESIHQGRMPIPAHIPREEEVIEPAEDVSGMTRIGEDVTEVLEYEVGRLWVRRIVRPRYARTAEQQQQQDQDADPAGAIVQAPALELPLGRSKAGVSLVAHILISKYVEHLPLHRLIQRFARSGLKVAPATIGNWVKSGADPLRILYEAYQKIIFRNFYLQMDETTIRVLEEGKGKTHLGYLWAVYDPVNHLPFFFYQTGRDHKGPKKLLERFVGILQCDGYSVYETLDKKMELIMLMNCLAHIRRHFFDARSNDELRANTALTMIKVLYQIEEKARKQGLNAEQRLELRRAESKDVFETFGKWLETEYNKVTPSSAIGKAIQYALNRWKNMDVFLQDGKVEIDNNLVENIIRPPAIGRKNYLFAGSHESAQRTAMLYTFFAACKQYNIDPEIWLNDILNRIGDFKVSQLEKLMPHRWKPTSAEDQQVM